MRKLRLHLDELHVETFEATSPSEEERGTVHGNNLSAQRCSFVECESVTNQVEACACFITEIGDTCDVCYNTDKCPE